MRIVNRWPRWRARVRVCAAAHRCFGYSQQMVSTPSWRRNPPPIINGAKIHILLNLYARFMGTESAGNRQQCALCPPMTYVIRHSSPILCYCRCCRRRKHIMLIDVLAYTVVQSQQACHRTTNFELTINCCHFVWLVLSLFDIFRTLSALEISHIRISSKNI